MKPGFAIFVAPTYLLLCIVVGGSQQGIWANAALQIAAVGLLFWTAIWRGVPPTTKSARQVTSLAILTLVAIALQLVPLPPTLWTALPGRGLLVEGFRDLHLQLPWAAISEVPYETVIAAFAILPPLAAFAAVQLVRDESVLATALALGAVAAIILGQLQVGASDRQWHFYEITSSGPVGFFANINHMGTLLLVSIPFAVALLVGKKRDGHPSYAGVQAGLISVAMVLLLIGVVLNGSLAAFFLAGPIVLTSGLLLPAGRRFRWLVMPLAGVAVIGAVFALSMNPIERAFVTEAASFTSRQEIWATTISAIEESFPFGTGLGSFQDVYATYEDQSSLSNVYINHAHNDYLQVALELGAVGIILVALFLVWWVRQSARVWQSNAATPFQKAATIASAAILAHSFVDYPLRTAAIAAVFGMCIGLMVRRPRRSDKSARHLQIA